MKCFISKLKHLQLAIQFDLKKKQLYKFVVKSQNMASEQMATEAAPAVVDAKTKDQEDSLVFKMKLSEQAER